MYDDNLYKNKESTKKIDEQIFNYFSKKFKKGYKGKNYQFIK